MWAALVNVIMQTCECYIEEIKLVHVPSFLPFFLVAGFAEEQPRRAIVLSLLRSPDVSE